MYYNRVTGEFEEEPNENNDKPQTPKFKNEKEKNILQSIKAMLDVSNNTKETLLKDFFDMNANDSIEELITLKSALRNLVKRLKLYEDIQLENAQLIVDMFIAENLGNNNNDYEPYYHIVEEVIYNLTYKELWDETDIKMAAMVCGHTIDFKSMKPFIERALIETKKKKDIGSELAIYTNSMMRLTTIKYIEIDNRPIEKDTKLEEVTELFIFYLDNSNKICEEHNYQGSKARILVREGIFLKNTEKINSGLKTLLEMGREDIVNNLKQEIKDLFNIEEEE